MTMQNPDPLRGPRTEINSSEIRAEQVANAQYEAIYLGVDLHKQSISVTRIIDHSTPQPAQRFGRILAISEEATGID